MMLTYVKGNLFDSPAKVLVNTVNTVGVMGKGIAKTFKDVYPEMFARYQQLCELNELTVGKLWLYKTPQKWILNFPTKVHWRNPSKIEYIEAGLKKFASSYSQQSVTSIAFPQLGCGNGELNWSDVEPLMVSYLRPLPINIYIYLYERDADAPIEHRNIQATREWLHAEPGTFPFAEFWNDLRQVVGGATDYTKWENGEIYSARVVKFDQEGLLLTFGTRSKAKSLLASAREGLNTFLKNWSYASDNEIFIPSDALVELWQSIRFHGFCYSKTMPAALELLNDYLMPILSRLDYLKKTRLSGVPGGKLESGLQLFMPESAPRPASPPVRAAIA